LETVASESSGDEFREEDTERFFAPPPGEAQPDESEGGGTKHVYAPVSEQASGSAPPLPSLRTLHPADPKAVRKAIDEVMEITSKLREALDQMDEILEILEEAERQKTVDEREIEALRQALGRFQRPPLEIPRPALRREHQHQPQREHGSYQQPQRDQRARLRDQRDPRGMRGPRPPQPAPSPPAAQKPSAAESRAGVSTAPRVEESHPPLHGTDAEHPNG
jgi:hypothetical protein